MGLNISRKELTWVLLALVLSVAVFTIMFGPPMEKLSYLMGIMGLKPEAVNECRTKAKQGVGTVCTGTFNTCNVIGSEQICEEAGCTWKVEQKRCIKASGDNPACQNLSPLHCTQVNR